MNVRAIWLVAWGVLIEAVRRREIYAIVLVSMLLIGAVMMVDFFNIAGLVKFYREIALKIMSIATSLAVVVLAARQLPREFETRTIYPLLAKPITRLTFLAGKLLGVLLSAIFCFGIFMVIFVLGTLYLKGTIPWGLFAQYIYLQLIQMLVLATLCFWLSMVLNLDAAITVGVLFFIFAATLTTMTSYIYDFASPIGQWILVGLMWLVPQLTLFDLSEKTVHSEFWEPLAFGVMGSLTLYGLVYASLYFALAMNSFRRRPL